jgi:hypothetical protein
LVDAVPDPEIGGILAQLLQDVESDWSLITAADLVLLPRTMSKVKLEVDQREQYAAAVYIQLQRLGQATSAEVAAASKQGSGPVDLLYALCWLVMESRPGDAGDTTLNGLAAVVHSGDSSSSEEASAAAADHGAKLREMFELTAAVTRPILPSLSGPQVVDLAHMCVMGAMLDQDCQCELLKRLTKPQAMQGLSPGQQLALLCVVERLQALVMQEGKQEAAELCVAQLLKVSAGGGAEGVQEGRLEAAELAVLQMRMVRLKGAEA